MIRKLLTLFVLPKIVAYVGRRLSGRATAQPRRPR
jgi:hypothetical protein